MEPSPRLLRLTGLAGQPLTCSVVLKPGSPLSFQVLEAEEMSLEGHCRVTAIEPATDGSTVLHIAAPAATEPALLRDTILVRAMASDGKEYTEKIPAVIDHLDEISVAPRGSLVFQKRATRELKFPDVDHVQRDLQVFASVPGIRFQVTKVDLLDVPEGLFEIECETIREGERTRVRVILRDHPSGKTIRGRLRIHTDHPESPIKEVRLYAVFEAESEP